MNVFDVLKNLNERGVFFCLQSSKGADWYSLAVESPVGKTEYYHSDNLKNVELFLDVMWGAKLKEKPKVPEHLVFPVMK